MRVDVLLPPALAFFFTSTGCDMRLGALAAGWRLALGLFVARLLSLGYQAHLYTGVRDLSSCNHIGTEAVLAALCRCPAAKAAASHKEGGWRSCVALLARHLLQALARGTLELADEERLLQRNPALALSPAAQRRVHRVRRAQLLTRVEARIGAVQPARVPLRTQRLVPGRQRERVRRVAVW